MGQTEHGGMDRDIYTQPGCMPQLRNEATYAAPAGDWLPRSATRREGDGVVNRNMILPTLRLESVRDGSEDFEYLTLLEKKMTALFEKWGVTEVRSMSIWILITTLCTIPWRTLTVTQNI